MMGDLLENPLFTLQLNILIVMMQNTQLSMTVWIMLGSILKCIILLMLVKPVSRMIVSENIVKRNLIIMNYIFKNSI